MMNSLHASSLRLPIDRRLPGLEHLLDPARFAATAAPLLPPGDRVRSCQPLYIRYKPQTNAVAVHALKLEGRPDWLLVHGKCHTDDDFGSAAEKAAQGRTADVAHGCPLVVRPSLRLLLFMFPHDQALSGLRFATTPKKVQRALYALEPWLGDDDWRISDRRMTIKPIRFKPEKRAVLRIDTRARHKVSGAKQPVRVYARVDAGQHGEAAAELMIRLHDEFSRHPWLRTPRVIGRIAEGSVTLVADAGRAPLPKGSDGAAAAGKALAALHGCTSHGLQTRGIDAILAAVADALDGVGMLAPELARDAARLRDEIARRAAGGAGDGPVGFVHGDFHPQQLLAREDGLTVLDFDRSCAGSQDADLGNFRAHLFWQALQTGQAPRTARGRADVFAASYAETCGREPVPAALAFWTAVGLALLAPTPFRILHPEWPRLTADLLAACRQELS
jgi:aminoglycoside phosphotransferase (APT) family kinase protein